MVDASSPDPIDGVIARLEALVAWAAQQPSRVGYFASLYLRVTAAVRSKIGTGYFDDDRRMEALDVAFASRYLTAVDQFRTHDPDLPAAWAVAFAAVGGGHPVVVQHLLLAMNPHINIDLAVAAARTCPGASIDALRADFFKINDVLAGIVPTVIAEMGEVSPLIALVNDLAEADEQWAIDFSMDAMRDASWAFANVLAREPVASQDKLITGQNTLIAALSQRIVSPPPLVGIIFDLIRGCESTNVAQIISVLDSGNPSLPARAARALAANPARDGEAPNRVYYFEVAPGRWAGSFTFRVTSWRILWRSDMPLKDKILATCMHVFQRVFGSSAIASELTAYPNSGADGLAINDIRIAKGFFTLFRSHERYTLNADGAHVWVDARVRFGPVPFLFREHDAYPAHVFDGGMRNVYHIRLLGTRFVGNYHVRPDRTHVDAVLQNGWSVAHETLTKIAPAAG